MAGLNERPDVQDVTVDEQSELVTILGHLVETDAPPMAFVGVLSAIPATLRPRDVARVAAAVYAALNPPPGVAA